MNVSCPDCRSVFRVDPAKVPAAGVDVRCNVCSAVFLVALPALPNGDSTNEAIPQAASRGAAEPSHNVGTEPSESRNAVVSTAEDAEARGPELQSPGVAAPITTAPGVDEIPRGADIPAALGPDAIGTGSAGGTTPTSAAAAPANADVGSAPNAAPADSRPRPVNPYLNNSPELRARRLARALVSDLVAYNPQKREQGLRDGTLRQLFRDEIRKSWEEYVEQVGAHVAESTPHFQDALNDVLAGGRRVF